MVAASVLPDTSAWIEFFRGLDSPLARGVNDAIVKCAVVTCGVVQYEVLQGARGEEGASILSAFEAIPFLEVTRDLWVEAGLLSSRLRRAGHRLPLSDILIATLAIRHDATVLSLDPHFSLIDELKVANS